MEKERVLRDSNRIIMAAIFIVASMGAGILFVEPMKAHGQPKGKASLYQGNARDPFLLPSGVRPLSRKDTASAKDLSKSDASPTEPPPLSLTVKAILISDSLRLASIDRHIVTVGDSIYDEKVLEIKRDRVILGKGDKKRTLLLSQSPLRLTVEER
jgi:hypothetical protein